ncbi:MAG TPA: branched-chain amino acid ABC transporter substrate-binding protein, partial [Quisquiliibacterium sp.]|nr:branched-chain amino acid ABC transporter substrate-binding protein [Quisquiliibacterium sp.]
MRKIFRAAAAAVAVGTALFSMQASAQSQPTIKLVYTDPLSGPFAQVGDANLKQWQYVISYINATGG